jgi:hypothetical protein
LAVDQTAGRGVGVRVGIGTGFDAGAAVGSGDPAGDGSPEIPPPGIGDAMAPVGAVGEALGGTATFALGAAAGDEPQAATSRTLARRMTARRRSKRATIRRVPSFGDREMTSAIHGLDV